MDYFESFSAAVASVAGEHGVPTVARLDEFNGPGHDQDPVDRGLNRTPPSRSFGPRSVRRLSLRLGIAACCRRADHPWFPRARWFDSCSRFRC
jgi:hypothetical protein